MRALPAILSVLFASPAYADIRLTYQSDANEMVVVDVKDEATFRFSSGDPEESSYVLFANGATYTIQTAAGKQAALRDDLAIEAGRLVAKRLAERGLFMNNKLRRQLQAVTELEPAMSGKWDSRFFDVKMLVDNRNVQFRFAASAAPELKTFADAFLKYKLRELEVERRSIAGGIFWDSLEIQKQDIAAARLSDGITTLAKVGAPTIWWGTDLSLRKIETINTESDHYAIPPHVVTAEQMADTMVAALDAPEVRGKLNKPAEAKPK